MNREHRELVAKVLFIAGLGFASLASLWIIRTLFVVFLGGLD